MVRTCNRDFSMLSDVLIQGEQYRTKHSFKGTQNKQLSFDKGVPITVIAKLANGWWQGRLPDGQVRRDFVQFKRDAAY